MYLISTCEAFPILGHCTNDAIVNKRGMIAAFVEFTPKNKVELFAATLK